MNLTYVWHVVYVLLVIDVVTLFLCILTNNDKHSLWNETLSVGLKRIEKISLTLDAFVQVDPPCQSI